MLHLWVQSSGRQATGNDLETALNVIGRADVIRRCMYNVKEVTDLTEKAVAKGYLDKSMSDFRLFQQNCYLTILFVLVHMLFVLYVMFYGCLCQNFLCDCKYL